ncbi:hypothetical protein BofuT4_P112310.1 [Botrytis cinerea T4]|uniref:Uncharacterized protein n=1 Tax=Botryotinia fuckeliana (strain T4) TaxID=999810 RepID=G2Y5W6_BOTF4|nr:hypothetical protein BofuT4_P112310.1 [Botrytis cinerea T4]
MAAASRCRYLPFLHSGDTDNFPQAIIKFMILALAVIMTENGWVCIEAVSERILFYSMSSREEESSCHEEYSQIVLPLAMGRLKTHCLHRSQTSSNKRQGRDRFVAVELKVLEEGVL